MTVRTVGFACVSTPLRERLLLRLRFFPPTLRYEAMLEMELRIELRAIEPEGRTGEGGRKREEGGREREGWREGGKKIRGERE